MELQYLHTLPQLLTYSKGTIQEHMTSERVRIKCNKVVWLAATVLQRRGTLHSVDGTAPLQYTGRVQVG
jgi:hypothetical protein